VAFADGSERVCHGILVPVTIHQRSPLAEQLGAAVAEPSGVAADALEVDERSQTTVPGLFAAGDATAGMPSVPNAIASGHRAAAMIVQAVMAEGIRLTPSSA
jgi:pyruvate/2-oxoglutarate dehydrogenase complex dihydrolipoamide dehydrogenase (E3) component